MPTKHTATDSRGAIHKRTSEERIYSHAIVAYRPATDEHPARSFVSWASRTDLAHKEARKWHDRPGVIVEIVEAVTVATKPRGGPQ